METIPLFIAGIISDYITVTIISLPRDKNKIGDKSCSQWPHKWVWHSTEVNHKENSDKEWAQSLWCQKAIITGALQMACYSAVGANVKQEHKDRRHSSQQFVHPSSQVLHKEVKRELSSAPNIQVCPINVVQGDSILVKLKYKEGICSWYQW